MLIGRARLSTAGHLLRVGVDRDNTDTDTDTDTDKASGAKTSRRETARHADKAYGIPELRRWLRGRHRRPCRLKGGEPGQDSGRRRQVGERTIPAFPATAGRCPAILGLADPPRCRSPADVSPARQPLGTPGR
ncbi:hypothetical protein OHS70_01565 [Streptomyces sp. NBC_00390]|uniref:hypothetical protein n=1 Tax=Streptomyces sp. NBC_00390 TaxID=2975736 RepID=UPI002E247BB3